MKESHFFSVRLIFFCGTKRGEKPFFFCIEPFMRVMEVEERDSSRESVAERVRGCGMLRIEGDAKRVFSSSCENCSLPSDECIVVFGLEANSKTYHLSPVCPYLVRETLSR